MSLKTASCLLTLGVLIARFEDLVNFPIESLLSTILPTAILSNLLSSLFTSPIHRVATSIILTTGLGVTGTYILLVLMGAPVTTHVPHTILLAVLVAWLGLFPLFTRLGLNGQAWRDLVRVFGPSSSGDQGTAKRVRREVGVEGLYGQFYGTFLGAYLGAVPIPLDWDREWQKWPVTVVVGTCLGAVLGAMVQDGYNYFYDVPSDTKHGSRTKKRM